MKLLGSTVKRAERQGREPKHWPRKRAAREIAKAAFIYFDSFNTPIISTATGRVCKVIRLLPDRVCTIGRSHRTCDYVLEDRQVSRRHCQILFDGFNRKIFIFDGGPSLTKLLVRFNLDKMVETAIRPSLNGIFLNGFKITRGALQELSPGDEVLFVCRQNERLVGFFIQRVIFTEEALQGREAAASAPLYPSPIFRGDDRITTKANFYLAQCRCILDSDDPISLIPGLVRSYSEIIQGSCSCSRPKNYPTFLSSPDAELSPLVGLIPCPSQGLHNVDISENIRGNNMSQSNSIFLNRQPVQVSEFNPTQAYVPAPADQLQLDHAGFPPAYVISSPKPKILCLQSMGKKNDSQSHGVVQNNTWVKSCLPPGKKFYLNRLEFMNYSSSGNHTVISLAELLFPVQNISRIFVATFTSDVLW